MLRFENLDREGQLRDRRSPGVSGLSLFYSNDLDTISGGRFPIADANRARQQSCPLPTVYCRLFSSTPFSLEAYLLRNLATLGAIVTRQ